MKPFLLLAIRAEDAAADNEYDSFLTLAGLDEGALLEPYSAQLAFIEPGQSQERAVFVIGRGVLGADGQQQERFHPITLNRLGSCRSQRAERADPARQMAGMAGLPFTSASCESGNM